MNDIAWAKGMAELLTLPDGGESPERRAIRGVTYRRELDGLSDELWLASVRMALQREKWFPSVATLLEFASEAATALPRWNQIPENTMTPEERQANIRRGLEVFKSELKRLGIEAPDAFVAAISREPGAEG